MPKRPSNTGMRYGFIGALDFHTVGGEKRMVGDMKFVCAAASGGSTVVGFENHIGKTYLGQALSPLGTVVSGFGNNGEDGTEGVRYRNVFGSYCPILPKNPVRCDRLLRCALERKYGACEPEPLRDTVELLAHAERS